MTMHSYSQTNKQSLQCALSHAWYVRCMQPVAGQGTKRETLVNIVSIDIRSQAFVEVIGGYGPVDPGMELLVHQ